MDQPMNPHRFASVPPMLPDTELALLAEDIRKHGLKVPLVSFQGSLLDGRNRSAACKIAGVEPQIVEFIGTEAEALAHARSLNGKRRHETSGQRAMADAKYSKFEEECVAAVAELEAAASERKAEGQKSGGRGNKKLAGTNSGKNGEVREQRAKSAGTNAKYIDAADEVVAEAPDLAEQVLTGAITLPEAKRQSQARKGGSNSKKKDVGMLKESADKSKELVQLVNSLAQEVTAFAKSKAGAFVNATLMNRNLRDLRQELRRAVLAQPCKDCSGKGCILCKDVGFVTSRHYQ